MSLLLVDNLSVEYGKKQVLHDISIKLEKGQMVGILGPNGCGKTTLMKALCNGIKFSGNITIEDCNINDLSERMMAQKCVYVPQVSGMSIDITVLDVVLMGFYPYLGIFDSPNEEMRNKAKEILSKLGLEQKIYANFMELSEGQKRLCILARSLAPNVNLLLMDEPDAALDFCLRNTVLQTVKDRVKNQQCAALITMHDTNLALMYCDSIFLMKDGEFAGVINKDQDTLTDMEKKLSILYGNIHLLEYERDNGEKQLIMV